MAMKKQVKSGNILTQIIEAQDELALKFVTSNKPVPPTELALFEKIGKYIAIRKGISDERPGSDLSTGENDDDI